MKVDGQDDMKVDGQLFVLHVRQFSDLFVLL